MCIRDSVYTTLNTKGQRAAYNALQGQKGAVVAMDPETGKIYAMVSKPDYRPGLVEQNWAELNSSKNSLLLNRATPFSYTHRDQGISGKTYGSQHWKGNANLRI